MVSSSIGRKLRAEGLYEKPGLPIVLVVGLVIVIESHRRIEDEDDDEDEDQSQTGLFKQLLRATACKLADRETT
jgi:hypothetical protein